eukprot:Polyplicarium_translucidae@DN2372_c0_g1_i1.p1
MDPYVKVQLNQTELQSEVMRDAGTQAVINTAYHFPYSSERHIRFQVWDRERMRRNREVGRVKINLERLLTTGEKTFENRVALSGPKGKEGGHLLYRMEFLDTAVSTATVKACEAIEVKYGERSGPGAPAVPPSRYGAVKVHLHHGRDLYDPQLVGKMDPYAILKVGGVELQSEVCKDQGKNPDFDTIYIFPYASNDREMSIELKDREHMKRDQAVGTVNIDLHKLMTGPGPHEVHEPVCAAKKGRDGGFIDMDITFMPDVVRRGYVGSGKEAEAVVLAATASPDSDDASSQGKTMLTVPRPAHVKGVSIFVSNGTSLYSPETIGKMDPFVKVRHGKKWLESEYISNKGQNPDFNTVFMFPYENHRRVKFDVHDKQTKGSRSVGTVKLDLQPLMGATGPVPLKLSLRNPKGKQEGVLDVVVELVDRDIPAANAFKQLPQ